MMFRHLPNILSSLRILALPVLFFLMWKKQEEQFVLLLVVCLITDILDGFLARRFGWSTPLGARLDSLADLGIFSVAIVALFVLQNDFVTTHVITLLMLFIAYSLSPVITIFRFRQWPSYHLWSAKITAYLQGLFFVLLFAHHLPNWYYWLTWCFSVLAYLEEGFVAARISSYRSNVKSYFMLHRDD